MEPQKSDQSQWFAAEVQPHESSLRAYLHARFPSLGDIDDLVQESYVRVLRAKETGRIECAKAYLFATARNAALAIFRRPRIFANNPVTDFDALHVLEEGDGLVEKLCTKQEIALLLDVIDSLPSRCREIFILRKLQGVSQKEIAARLGLSEQTVQVQIGRGAKRCALLLRRRGVTGRHAEDLTEDHHAGP